MITKVKRKDASLTAFLAPLLAVAIYLLSYFATNFAAQILLGVWWYSLIVLAALLTASSLGCMALSRWCCDVIFKEYSGRGPFILFLCVAAVRIAMVLMKPYGGPNTLLFDLAWPVLTGAGAYWWFWRGAIEEHSPEAE